MTVDFAEAVEQARAGLQQGYTTLYESTYKTQYYNALKFMGEEQKAQDVLQNAYLKAFQNLHTLTDPSGFHKWMSVIVANTARDELRKKTPVLFSDMGTESDEGDMLEYQIEDEDSFRQPEQAYTQRETQELVHELLANLTDEQRMCVVMYHLEGLSIKEIAETMMCSENTVKSRLNYGRKNIKLQAEELQKKGVKLYTASPVALLLFLMEKEREMLSVPDSIVNGLDQILSVSNGAATAATSAVSQGAAQSALVKTAAAGVVKTAFFSTVKGKIIGAVLGLCVMGAAVGAGVGATIIMNQNHNAGENVGDAVPTAGNSGAVSGGATETATPEPTEEPEIVAENQALTSAKVHKDFDFDQDGEADSLRIKEKKPADSVNDDQRDVSILINGKKVWSKKGCWTGTTKTDWDTRTIVEYVKLSSGNVYLYISATYEENMYSDTAIFRYRNGNLEPCGKIQEAGYGSAELSEVQENKIYVTRQVITNQGVIYVKNVYEETDQGIFTYNPIADFQGKVDNVGGGEYDTLTGSLKLYKTETGDEVATKLKKGDQVRIVKACLDPKSSYLKSIYVESKDGEAGWYMEEEAMEYNTQHEEPLFEGCYEVS